MARIFVCTYLDFAIEVDPDTGMFYAPGMQLERTSMAPLKAAIRDESKARSIFKPFLLVERDNPGKIYAKCVNRDGRGYRQESGRYISNYEMKGLAVVPDTYMEDAKDAIVAWELAMAWADKARERANELRAQITAGYPSLGAENP